MVSTIRKILLSGLFKIFRTIAYKTNGMFREFQGGAIISSEKLNIS